MRLFKFLLVVILIVSPYPIGHYLIERSFLSTSKSHLVHGDIPKDEVPNDYCPLNQGFFFEIPNGPFKGKKMFYQDGRYGGSGLTENTILFVHGNLSSSYIYNDVIAHLKKRTPLPVRIVAMDLLGFGLSDRAPFPISPKDYAETLLDLITHLDLTDVILVAHEWGGPLGISALLNTPDRVKGIVLINASVFKLTEKDKVFHSFQMPFLGSFPVSTLIPDIVWGKYVVYSIFSPPAPSTLVKIDVMKNIAMGRHPRSGGLQTDEIRFYEHHLRSEENIENAKNFLKYAVYFKEGFTKGETEIESSMEGFSGFIDKNLNGQWGPGGLNICAFALFSDQDVFASPVVIDKWKTDLPQLEGHIRMIRDTGGFLQKERPEEVSDAIISTIAAIKKAAAPVEEVLPAAPIAELNEEEFNEE